MATYTGVIDPSPLFTTQLGQMYPDDRQGTLVEINSLPAGKSVDNFFFFNSPTSGKFLARVIDGSMRAAYCGVYLNTGAYTGVDQGAQLDDVLNNTAIMEVVFDYPEGGDILIDSAVTVPAGKVLRFAAGNKLVGTGSITGGIIDADYNQQIFASTLTVDPEGVTGNQVSAKWYGASGTVGNSAPPIQAVIDMVIRNASLPRDIYFPPDNYACSEPLIIYKWDGSNYVSCTANLVGTYTAHGANPPDTARLTFSSKTTFGVGIQRGYSCVIKGLTIAGPFNPIFNTPYDFYTSDFDTYATGDSMRDTVYSPNAGIVFDPFRFTNTVPPDGGYPGYEDWYRGTGDNNTHAGSSECVVIGCRVYGFTVDICISPNGQTQQGEDILVDTCILEVAKVAYACTQRQTKGNLIKNCRGWDRVHTFLDTRSYGNTGGTPPYIIGLNIAGTVKRVFNVSVQHPVAFDNIYCESLGEIGFMDATYGNIAVRNSNFDFVTGTRYIPTYHLTGINVEFQSCTIRYYDDFYNKRIFVIGFGNTFQNCWFDVAPLTDSGTYSQQGAVVTYINCRSGENVYFGFEQYTASTDILTRRFLAYGNMQFYDIAPGINAGVLGYTNLRINVPSHQSNYTFAFVKSVTVNSSMATATFTDPFIATSGRLGDYIVHMDSSQHIQLVIGRITAIDRSTGVVDLAEVPFDTVSGVYNLGYVVVSHIKQAFIGDIAIGTNTITNVEYSKSFSNNAYQVGDFCPLIGGDHHQYKYRQQDHYFYHQCFLYRCRSIYGFLFFRSQF